MFVGIDLGTSGVRVMGADLGGKNLVQAAESFPSPLIRQSCPETATGIFEQNPEAWRVALDHVLGQFITKVKDAGLHPEDIQGLCTTSTSGTILAIDADGQPLTNAIMYSDQRAQAETPIVQAAAKEFSEKMGYGFNATFALPKILWLKQHRPEIYARATKILHANDFLVGLLSGSFIHSDSSNCLKTGYDWVAEKWPDFIESNIGISISKLPEVVSPGHKISETTVDLEKQTGFPTGVPIFSGATDSIMALIASGACRAGDVFSSLGSTLVTRVLTSRLVRDPIGRVYCHLLPGTKRIYLPGGASSVGAECLTHYFPNVNYARYDAEALERAPVNPIVYPLVRPGERFPFIAPNACHYYFGSEYNDLEKYAAYLQGVAFVERLGLEILEGLGAKAGDRVYTVGGGAKSNAWSQIRADVLKKEIHRPKIIEAAYGAVILGAAAYIFSLDLAKASEKFVQENSQISPRPEFIPQFNDKYRVFCAEIRNKFKIEIPLN